jgi:hypothetical protein
MTKFLSRGEGDAIGFGAHLFLWGDGDGASGDEI